MNDQKLTPDPQQELLELMRKKEMREAKEFEKKELAEREARENYELRLQRQKDNDAQVFAAAAHWQSRCDHRKGTSGKKKWRHIDYDVSKHTFVNGLTVIKCLKCKFRAFPGDTETQCSYTLDNYMKGAKKEKIGNPTRKSYKDWFEMTLDENTTNTETRSEMITQGPQPVNA